MGACWRRTHTHTDLCFINACCSVVFASSLHINLGCGTNPCHSSSVLIKCTRQDLRLFNSSSARSSSALSFFHRQSFLFSVSLDQVTRILYILCPFAAQFPSSCSFLHWLNCPPPQDFPFYPVCFPNLPLFPLLPKRETLEQYQLLFSPPAFSSSTWFFLCH